jgi:hypothetical protein
MFASMAADKKTKGRLDGTRDEQFSAIYFAPDVAGASNVLTNTPAACGSGNAAIEFRGETYNAVSLATTITVVSYVFTTPVVDGVPTGRLQRSSCEGPSLGSLTLSSTQTVARTLSSAPPSPSCTPSPCGATTRSVSLVLTRQGADSAFTLLGTRRAS